MYIIYLNSFCLVSSVVYRQDLLAKLNMWSIREWIEHFAAQ